MSQEHAVIDVEEEEAKRPALPAVIDSPVMDLPAFRKAIEFESERIDLMQKFVASKMVENTHFGTIPGSKKPCLWKSGAEVMAGVYRYGARYKLHVTEEYDATREYSFKRKRYGKWETVEGTCRGFYEVRVSCTLYHTISGVDVGEGVGSCNNWEKKYITQDLFEIKNTILKMGKKRAYVDAILSACRLSDFFTQDFEDLDIASEKETETPREKADKQRLKKMQEDNPERRDDRESDEIAKMKDAFQAHCGADFPRGTRLMQKMSQLKPDYQQAKGWGAMSSDKWRIPTMKRFERHVKVCKDENCPEQALKMHEQMGWVPVD